MPHKFDPAHASRLLSPERRQWQNPEAILGTIGLAPGMTFADVGAGPGFFTLPAATLVGPTGSVRALDVEPRMIEFLGERVAATGHANVRVLLSKESELPLDDASVDVALISNVLHEATERIKLLRDVARTLRAHGALGVVEWRKEEMPMGPPLPDRLSAEQVETALVEAGFAEVETFPAGPYHYGLKARVSHNGR